MVPFSDSTKAGGSSRSTALSDDDVLAILVRGQAVHADVQEALGR